MCKLKLKFSQDPRFIVFLDFDKYDFDCFLIASNK